MAGQQKNQSSGGGLVTLFVAAGVLVLGAAPSLGIMPVVILVLVLVILGFARAAVGGRARKPTRQVPVSGGSPAGQTPPRRLGEAEGFGQYQSAGAHHSAGQHHSSGALHSGQYQPFNPGRQQASPYSATMPRADQDRLKADIRARMASSRAGQQALEQYDAAESTAQRVVTRRGPNPRPTSQPGPRPAPRPTSTPQAPPASSSRTEPRSSRRAPGSEIDLGDIDLSDAESRLRPGADVNLHDVKAAPVGDDLNLPAGSRARRPVSSAVAGSLTGSSAISDAAVTSSLLGSALASSSLFASGTGSSLTLTSLTHLHDAD